MTDEKIIDRGGVKTLWKRFVSKLKTETAGFATADMISDIEEKLGFFSFDAVRAIENYRSDTYNSYYTLASIAVNHAVPFLFSTQGIVNNAYVALPSGGTYFVIGSYTRRYTSGDSTANSSYDIGTIYSGGTKIVDGRNYGYSLRVLIFRIS